MRTLGRTFTSSNGRTMESSFRSKTAFLFRVTYFVFDFSKSYLALFGNQGLNTVLPRLYIVFFLASLREAYSSHSFRTEERTDVKEIIFEQKTVFVVDFD